ncbi:putative tail receptor-binding protein [Ochrobactrum phage vB_OspM_OC]|nr:putative tail receptor-binding protein [Ochrobactrum phage vB_OspM_OC]
MTTIRITELDRNTSPSKTDLLATDNTTTGTRASTIEEAVNSVVKKANNEEAVTGTDNTKFMTPESTKTAIDGLSVPKTRTISTTSDLTGGGALTGNLTIGLSSGVIANLAKANTSVQPEQLELKLDKPSGGTNGDLIRGDGSLVAANTFATNTQGALADTAVQPSQLTAYALKSENDLKLDKPVDGTANNIIKGDGTIVELSTLATSDQGTKADNAVLFTGQNLTETQKSQARNNIGTDYLNPYRNKLLNGGFSVAQRGNGPFTQNEYTLDRWYLFNGSGSVNEIKRINTTTNDYSSGVLPRSTQYNVEWKRSASGTETSWFGQRIEGVHHLTGRKITLTFYAKALQPVKLFPYVHQSFDNVEADPLYTPFPDVNITTEWQKFTYTIDLPLSLNIDTIGYNSYANIFFNWYNTEPNTTITISRISVVEGDATLESDPFSPRHIQQELALCQRYYQNSIVRFKVGQTQVGQTFYITSQSLPVEMRIIPTITSNNQSVFTQNNTDTITTSSNLIVAITATTKTLRINGQYNGAGNTSGFSCDVFAMAEL